MFIRIISETTGSIVFSIRRFRWVAATAGYACGYPEIMLKWNYRRTYLYS